MTILSLDKFAFTPKRCENCNRLFLFEQYYVLGYKQYGCKYCYITKSEEETEEKHNCAHCGSCGHAHHDEAAGE